MKRVTEEKFDNYINNKVISSTDYDQYGVYINFTDDETAYIQLVDVIDAYGNSNVEAEYHIDE